MKTVTRLFADDSSLQESSADLNVIEQNLNHDIQRLQDWSNNWLMQFNPAKTKAVIFSSRPLDVKPNLICNNEPLSFADSHCHLGVTLSSNCNWNDHVQNIIKTASCKITALKQLKNKVSKQTLNTIYISFIRPTLEYASCVWDGCSEELSNALERVQLEAARLVSGLSSVASCDALYLETGWLPLKSRREKFKLSTFHKIHNRQVPDYLHRLLPPNRGDLHRDLRNPENYQLPRCRLDIFKKSYIPSTISLWNRLDNSVKSITSSSAFNVKISPIPPVLPMYMNAGNRYLSVLLARIRHRCSGLNSDLFRVGIRPSPICHCGNGNEDSHHYILFVRILQINV